MGYPTGVYSGPFQHSAPHLLVAISQQGWAAYVPVVSAVVYGLSLSLTENKHTKTYMCIYVLLRLIYTADWNQF